MSKRKRVRSLKEVFTAMRGRWKVRYIGRFFRRLIRFALTFLLYIVEAYLLWTVITLLFVKGTVPSTRFFTGVPILGTLEGLFRNCWLNTLIMEVVEMKDPPREAIAPVISAIGVGGVYMTWLIGAAEQRVCGVRTGELLGWLHKLFIFAYAVLFLPLVFLGVFAGNANLQTDEIMNTWIASLYALLGVILGLLFTMLVWLELVQQAGSREARALQYYTARVSLGPVRWGWRFFRWLLKKPYLELGCSERDKKFPHCFFLWLRDRYSMDFYITRSTRWAMFCLADHYREQMLTYHKDVSMVMARIWLEACWVPFDDEKDFSDTWMNTVSWSATSSQYMNEAFGRTGSPQCAIVFDGEKSSILTVNWGGVRYPEAYLSGGLDYVVANALFSSDVWDKLLQGVTSKDQSLELVRPLLYNLYHAEHDARDKRYLASLLGLLFCLEDQAKNDCALIRRVHSITVQDGDASPKELVPQEIRCHMAWALMMILSVKWLQEPVQSKHIEELKLIYGKFHAEFDIMCTEDTENSKFKFTDTLLWYAEWISTRRKGFPINQYLIRLGRSDWPQSGYTRVETYDFSYRRRFLLRKLVPVYRSDLTYHSDSES